MTRRRDRIFAWVGVVVAIFSVVAFTTAVIAQQIISDRADKAAQAQTQAQTAAANCKSTTGEATLPTPDIYKPDGAVTSLQKTDLAEGTGQVAKAGDCLVVKYYGTLASTGTKFDENFSLPTGFAFVVGNGSVIAGWDQGLIGMKVGGTRRLVIPSKLAYGSQSPSASIPANSDLVFVVKLLKIQK